MHDTIEIHGYRFRVVIEPDDEMRAPWEDDDGHGPISDWTRRDKLPGERVLCEDRGLRRYYDFAAAVKLARRYGWDAPPFGRGTTHRRAARAAEADFQYLRRWCAGDWRWVGVVVILLDDDGEETEETGAIWGIESDKQAYIETIARDLAQDIVDAREAESAAREFRAAQNVVKIADRAP